MLTPEDPLAVLAQLRRQGELVVQYPLVCRLAAAAPRADRGRLGHWLRRIDALDITRRHPDIAVLRIAVTGNSTLAPLVPHLVGTAAAAGLAAHVQLGGYGQYRQQLLDPASDLYAGNPDLTVCLLDAYAVFDEVPAVWTVEDVTAVLDRKLAEIRGLADVFATQPTGGLLVLNTVPLPRIIAHQLLDYRSRGTLGAAWRRWNAALLDLAVDNDRVLCLDLEVLGDEAAPAGDARLSLYARQRLPEPLLAAYAGEIVHLGRSLVGRAKKCLVLDLDGTLWGGILAEDGVDGIELGGDAEGAGFQALQRVVKQLGSQGVLLAVCSKNDADEVAAALRDNPDMVLSPDDFVAVAANWRPKPDNLTELAQALNISIDSFVFVDDSAFECGFVRESCPGVAVIHADADPATRITTLLADSWFASRVLTETDRHRPAAYRTELERRTFLSRFASLDDYLSALQLTVRVAPATPGELPRLAQLTQRTNQFNLTTERLDVAAVAARAGAQDTGVWTIAASDRFGDHGIVGAVFTSRSADGTALVIDNFLLSCRVFGRDIETAGLSQILQTARAAGLRRVLGRYRRTAKNAKLGDFYPDHGFAATAVDDAEATFEHTLDAIPPVPAHITLHATGPQLLAGSRTLVRGGTP